MSTRLTLTLALLLTAPAARAQTPAAPAGTIEYYHVDALGSVRAVTDASGAVVRTYHYHPFGEGVGVEAGTDPMRFTGKPRDGETGLDYFGARYYAQRTGRFTTVDPVYTWKDNPVDPQRWNRYTYVRNNPARYVDPDGRILWPVVAVAAAAGIFTASNANAPKPGDPTFRSDTAGDVIANAAAAGIGEGIGAAISARLSTIGRSLFTKLGFFDGAVSRIASVDDALRTPAALKGMSPDSLMERIGTLPDNWKIETLGKGSMEGHGFVLREYGPNNAPTGRMIRWHPGGGHHGPEPYWRVNDYNSKSGIIR